MSVQNRNTVNRQATDIAAAAVARVKEMGEDLVYHEVMAARIRAALQELSNNAPLPAAFGATAAAPTKPAPAKPAQIQPELFRNEAPKTVREIDAAVRSKILEVIMASPDEVFTSVDLVTNPTVPTAQRKVITKALRRLLEDGAIVAAGRIHVGKTDSGDGRLTAYRAAKPGDPIPARHRRCAAARIPVYRLMAQTPAAEFDIETIAAGLQTPQEKIPALRLVLNNIIADKFLTRSGQRDVPKPEGGNTTIPVYRLTEYGYQKIRQALGDTHPAVPFEKPTPGAGCPSPGRSPTGGPDKVLCAISRAGRPLTMTELKAATSLPDKMLTVLTNNLVEGSLLVRMSVATVDGGMTTAEPVWDLTAFGQDRASLFNDPAPPPRPETPATPAAAEVVDVLAEPEPDWQARFDQLTDQSSFIYNLGTNNGTAPMTLDQLVDYFNGIYDRDEITSLVTELTGTGLLTKLTAKDGKDTWALSRPTGWAQAEQLIEYVRDPADAMWLERARKMQ